MVYFVCATPRSFKECYLIDCGGLCNCAKKSIFIYAVGMQHMRVCLDQISHFLNPFLFMYDLTHFSLAFLARHARLNMGHELQEMVDFLVDIWEQEGLYD
jgi:hypothetical protein